MATSMSRRAVRPPRVQGTTVLADQAYLYETQLNSLRINYGNVLEAYQNGILINNEVVTHLEYQGEFVTAPVYDGTLLSVITIDTAFAGKEKHY